MEEIGMRVVRPLFIPLFSRFKQGISIYLTSVGYSRLISTESAVHKQKICPFHFVRFFFVFMLESLIGWAHLLIKLI